MAKKAPIRKKHWEQRDWRWTQQRWLGLHNGSSLCEKERRWHGSWLHERGAIVPWIEKSIWLRLNSLFDGFISLYSELDDEPALIYKRMMGNDRHPCTRVKVSLLYICTFNIWKLYNIKELKYLKCKPFKLLKKKTLGCFNQCLCQIWTKPTLIFKPNDWDCLHLTQTLV